MSAQFKKFLSKLNIDHIAKSSKFVQREPKKITPLEFLQSFIIVYTKKSFSFRQWACQLSLLVGQYVSFQGLCKKCNDKCLVFVQELLNGAIKMQLETAYNSSGFKSKFARILVEDSTSWNLCRSMLKAFSGAGNGKSDVAMFKSHFCYDLLTMNTIGHKATGIKVNDNSQSSNILDYLKPDDLVLRDLGYLSNKILKKIAKKDAWFISRLKDNSKYFLPETDQEFNLAKELKKLFGNGQNKFIKVLTIGKAEKLTATVVAVRLNEDQVARRLKKYHGKYDKKQQMSDSKKELLHWSVMVTNIAKDKVDIDQIFKLYTLRWQIELLFKTWKSRFGINKVLKKYSGKDPNKVLILYTLFLLFHTAIYRPLHVKYAKIMKDEFNRDLSLQKFATLVMSHLEAFCKGNTNLTELVLKLGCHDKSRAKINHRQLIYQYT